MIRVLVIYGGCSDERDVSLQGGAAVSAALRAGGFHVGALDPAECCYTEVEPSDWDIVFPVLHGAGGEDGTLQPVLQGLGLPWVGCTAESSCLTFDKGRTRERLQQAGLPIAPGQIIYQPDELVTVTLPAVVKPACQGSSIGISIVRTNSDWQSAIQTAFSFAETAGDSVVIESFIEGREISVPVIHGDVFPPVEIIVPDGWYDYRNKYESELTRYVTDPDGLPADLPQLVQEVCRVCGADGILRVDLRVDHSGQPYVLEVNTIPGMTSHSLVPLSAQARGLSLAQLCAQCVRHRLQRAG